MVDQAAIESQAKSRVVPDHVPPELVVDLDVYNLPGGDVDAHAAWLAFRDVQKGPLVWSPYNEGHWVATVPADIAQFQRNSSVFSSFQVTVPDRGGARYIPLEIDPPAHGVYRRNIMPLFTGAALTALRSSIRDLAIHLIETVRPSGHCDFISDIGMKFPAAVALMILGLPAEDATRLNRITDTISRNPDLQEKLNAYGEMIEYVKQWMEIRRKDPGADGVSQIVSAQFEDRPYTDQEIESTLALLIGGAVDSVAMHMSFVMLHLAQNPGQRDYIKSNMNDLSVITTELFRRFPIPNMGRKLARDFEHAGILMKQDDIILLPPVLHNLSDAVYECPMNVKFDRPKGEKGHLTFGTGAHVCPGANLARIEMEILLEEWLTRIPEFSVKSDQPVGQVASILSGVTNLWLEWPKS